MSVVIGIAGGSGSGKTTVQRRVMERFGPRRIALLDHDAYYRDLDHLAPEDRVRFNFDHPDALETDLMVRHVDALLAGEAAGNFKPWGSPTNWRDPALGLRTTPDGFGGPNRHGTAFAIADGSVRMIDNKIDPQVLKALSTPNGGEIVPDDY